MSGKSNKKSRIRAAPEGIFVSCFSLWVRARENHRPEFLRSVALAKDRKWETSGY